MREDFSVEHRGDHIHVTLGAGFEIDPERRDEIWNILGTLCRQHKSSRVLVEGYVPGGERAPSEVVEAGQRTAAIPHLWLAFRLENFVPDETSELFEAVAASHGVRVKFFSDTEHALNWLRSNAPA